jgi:hypothetical protein
MKRLFLISTMMLIAFGLVAQNIPKVRRNASNMNHRERSSVNQVVDYTNTQVGDVRFLSSAVTLYIDDDGSDQTGDGTIDNPYQTTMKAIGSLDGTLPYANTGALRLVYKAGSYNVEDIFPYIERVNEIYALVTLAGATTITDTINVTHPGGAVQSYFRYSTDSTIVGDREGEFLGWSVNPFFGGVAGFPVAGNTADSIIMPAADAQAVGTNRFFFTLNTTFEIGGDFDYPTLSTWMGFWNINFNLTANGSSSSWGTSIRNLSFYSCTFTSSDEVYDVAGIDGIGYFWRCYFDHNSSSSSGDVLEFSGNSWGHVSNCYFHSDNSRTKGSQGLEIRKGAFVSAYQNIFDGFDEAIKADGGGQLALGATLFRNSDRAIHIHNPPRVFITEDGEPWTAGYDSLHCEDVTEFIYLYDTYDAGRDIYLPHLKAGGYDTFNTQTKYVNNTFDFGNMTAMTIGGDGFQYLKQPQITASLTDGAPTDAELDSATGTTPADVGAGWSVTIQDSDGSALLYRVESDGTNWQYIIQTIAL